jgi:hypothetical protein
MCLFARTQLHGIVPCKSVKKEILTFGETFRENTIDHTGFTSIGPWPFFADQFSSMSKITSKLKICIFYGGALTP